MTKPLVPDQLLPPGVKDERQLGFVRVLDSGLKTIDIQTFIMSDADTVDAKLLPFLVREFSLQEFIEPGLKDEFVRKLISNAYDLHSKKGYVEGTRLGLRMLGIEVSWTQWWQEEPKANHNTHKVKVIFDETLFEGAIMGDTKHQSAVTRMVNATKRWSQSIDINFFVRNQTAIRMGAIAQCGGVIRHIRDALTDQVQRSETRIGVLPRMGGIVRHGSANA